MEGCHNMTSMVALLIFLAVGLIAFVDCCLSGMMADSGILSL